MYSKSVASVFLLLSINILYIGMATGFCRSCNHGGGHYSTDTIKGGCPTDAHKLGACGDLLGQSLGISLETPAKIACCANMHGLADHEAATCLCTAIKVKTLGSNVDVQRSLNLILNTCGKKVPIGFQCA